MKIRRSIAVAIANEQRCMAIDRPLLRKAVRTVLGETDLELATVSLAIVDDVAMARLNEQYLNHLGPTDVLSFLLEEGYIHIDAELIVNAEMASRVAPEYKWSADEELLLYVIHGALHLIGYDDSTPQLRAKMRARERKHLATFGVKIRGAR